MPGTGGITPIQMFFDIQMFFNIQMFFEYILKYFSWLKFRKYFSVKIIVFCILYLFASKY